MSKKVPILFHERYRVNQKTSPLLKVPLTNTIGLTSWDGTVFASNYAYGIVTLATGAGLQKKRNTNSSHSQKGT